MTFNYLAVENIRKLIQSSAFLAMKNAYRQHEVY